MTQHTPGPWVDDAIPDMNGYCTIRPADGTKFGDTDAQPIATVYLPDDAQLIAASPDLLEALKEYLDWHEANFVLPSGNFEDPDQHKLAKAARAAIAKAQEE